MNTIETLQTDTGNLTMTIQIDIKTASALVTLADAIKDRTLNKAAYEQATRYARQLHRDWDIDALHDADNAECSELAKLLTAVEASYPTRRVEYPRTIGQRLVAHKFRTGTLTTRDLFRDDLN